MATIHIPDGDVMRRHMYCAKCKEHTDHVVVYKSIVEEDEKYKVSFFRECLTCATKFSSTLSLNRWNTLAELKGVGPTTKNDVNRLT